jgi:prepilin-type N-terminal cleavage/methylation domain-containing protein
MKNRMIQGLLARRRDDEGFTLIELLIVIIVLAILAAIVVFAVGTTRTDAVTSSCITNVKQVVTGAEAVFTKTGVYPTDPAFLVAGATHPGAILHSVPADPSGSYTIVYAGSLTPDSHYTIAVSGTHVATGGLKETSTDTDIAAACAGK